MEFHAENIFHSLTMGVYSTLIVVTKIIAS